MAECNGMQKPCFGAVLIMLCWTLKVPKLAQGLKVGLQVGCRTACAAPVGPGGDCPAPMGLAKPPMPHLLQPSSPPNKAPHVVCT